MLFLLYLAHLSIKPHSGMLTIFSFSFFRFSFFFLLCVYRISCRSFVQSLCSARSSIALLARPSTTTWWIHFATGRYPKGKKRKKGGASRRVRQDLDLMERMKGFFGGHVRSYLFLFDFFSFPLVPSQEIRDRKMKGNNTLSGMNDQDRKEEKCI